MKVPKQQRKKTVVTSFRLNQDGNKCKDLTGLKFGKLKAIEPVARPDHVEKSRNQYWRCTCKCGNTLDITAKNLLSGATTSCGCVFDAMMRGNNFRAKK